MIIKASYVFFKLTLFLPRRLFLLYLIIFILILLIIIIIIIIINIIIIIIIIINTFLKNVMFGVLHYRY